MALSVLPLKQALPSGATVDRVLVQVLSRLPRTRNLMSPTDLLGHPAPVLTASTILLFVARTRLSVLLAVGTRVKLSLTLGPTSRTRGTVQALSGTTVVPFRVKPRAFRRQAMLALVAEQAKSLDLPLIVAPYSLRNAAPFRPSLAHPDLGISALASEVSGVRAA